MMSYVGPPPLAAHASQRSMFTYAEQQPLTMPTHASSSGLSSEAFHSMPRGTRNETTEIDSGSYNHSLKCLGAIFVLSLIVWYLNNNVDFAEHEDKTPSPEPSPAPAAPLSGNDVEVTHPLPTPASSPAPPTPAAVSDDVAVADFIENTPVTPSTPTTTAPTCKCCNLDLGGSDDGDYDEEMGLFAMVRLQGETALQNNFIVKIAICDTRTQQVTHCTGSLTTARDKVWTAAHCLGDRSFWQQFANAFPVANSEGVSRLDAVYKLEVETTGLKVFVRLLESETRVFRRQEVVSAIVPGELIVSERDRTQTLPNMISMSFDYAILVLKRPYPPDRVQGPTPIFYGGSEIRVVGSNASEAYAVGYGKELFAIAGEYCMKDDIDVRLEDDSGSRRIAVYGTCPDEPAQPQGDSGGPLLSTALLDSGAHYRMCGIVVGTTTTDQPDLGASAWDIFALYFTDMTPYFRSLAQEQFWYPLWDTGNEPIADSE